MKCHVCGGYILNYSETSVKYFAKFGNHIHTSCINSDPEFKRFPIVMKLVSEYFVMTPETILSGSRKPDIIRAKSFLIWFLYEIGYKSNRMELYAKTHGWKGWDHANILHLKNNIQKYCEVDKQYRADQRELVKIFEEKGIFLLTNVLK